MIFNFLSKDFINFQPYTTKKLSIKSMKYKCFYVIWKS